MIDLEGVKPTAKLVLLALAIRANTEGRAWPSVKRICMDTGLSERAVQTALQSLVKDKFITMDGRSGHTSMLTIKGAVDNSDPRISCTPEGCISDGGGVQEMRQGVQEMHPEVVKERDKKEVRAAGTSPPAPAGNQNGNSNGHSNYQGPAPVAAQEAARQRRRQTAAACQLCDDQGVTLDGDGWCKH